MTKNEHYKIVYLDGDIRYATAQAVLSKLGYIASYNDDCGVAYIYEVDDNDDVTRTIYRHPTMAINA